MTSRNIESRHKDLYREARMIARAQGDDNPFDLRKYYTDEMRKEERELYCRSMVISCICYGHQEHFYDEGTGEFGAYGKAYAEDLGDKRALEIYRDESDFMKKHATIHQNVGTDCEGVTYNSITWDIY